MNMETLVLDGQHFVKASKAAKDLGYTADHVGQLCRSGQVRAHLLGRTWYVNPDDLDAHKVEKKRISRTKAREQAKKSIAEHREQVQGKVRNNYRNIAIRYESDKSELIPETKKLAITTTPVYRESEETDTQDDTENITYEHKGDKVEMQGSLDVIDVTDGPIDTETVFLKPKIYTASQKKKNVVMQAEDVENSPDIEPADTPDEHLLVEEEKKSNSAVKMTFASRLERLDSNETPEEERESEEIGLVSTKKETVRSSPSLLVCFIIILAILLLTTLSIGVETTLVYRAATPAETRQSLSVSFEEVKEYLRLKI